MLRHPLNRLLVLASCGLPLAVAAAGVSVRQDPGELATAPFPSDRYTTRDFSNITLRRVALPKPDCSVRPSDCSEIDVLNTLDGFSTQPRITVPFTGDIDLASVSSQTVYLINLGDTMTMHGAGQRVGINQVLWDPASKTLVFEPDALLAQHSRYLLVVTDGVRDAQGKKLKSDGWGEDFGLGHDRATADYHRDLRDALRHRLGGAHKPVAATLFTTQSITADLHKIMRQIKQGQPAPADFMIGSQGGNPVRAVFHTTNVAGIQFNRQTNTAPTFASSFLPTPALGPAGAVVGQVAYGRFNSPDYATAGKFIPATGTLIGQPAVQGSNPLTFQLFVPAGAKPAGGWPVAIFGHGFGDSMYGAPWTIAATLASQGIATLSINVVGHGGGAQGTLTVLGNDGSATSLPAGGRGIDQDGNTSIDSTEGVNAAPPRTLLGSRDGLRQTVVDLMQLVRQVEVGMDIDGDGSADMNPARIYYAGQSFGGIYGSILLGVEPGIAAGVPNVPGGSIAEVARLGAFRALTGIALASRVPSLINVGGISFNENIPLRNQPLVVNTVPGAMAVAQWIDRAEWAQQSGNPVSYAVHLRKQPLPGNTAKRVLVQFAKGDTTVPNPTTSAILRAGDLADAAVYFRNDLAVAANPAVAKNPHAFLTNIVGAGAPFAFAAQQQIALFFASHGMTVIDPDGAGPLFEVPLLDPLPETLNFLP